MSALSESGRSKTLGDLSFRQLVDKRHQRVMERIGYRSHAPDPVFKDKNGYMESTSEFDLADVPNHEFEQEPTGVHHINIAACRTS